MGDARVQTVYHHRRALKKGKGRRTLKSPTKAILALDAKAITRDNVMMMNIGLSLLGMVIITTIGLFKADTNWAEWFPFLVILSLVTGPAGYGFLFGLLMVDERDMGTRSVLAVTPVSVSRMIAIRMTLSTLLMVVWPLITVYVMNASWRVLDLPFTQWLGLVTMLSLIAPITALCVAVYATNKVEALALFKGVNFILITPLALYFLPAGTEIYRKFFLFAPSGPAVLAFEAFRHDQDSAAWIYLAGGALYCAALLAACVWYLSRTLYKNDA